MNDRKHEAIERFRRHLDRNCAESGPSALEVVQFEVKEIGKRAFVTARLECGPSVSETSLLRFLSSQWWLVIFGPRGAATVKMAPQSYKQFNGRRAFGMFFQL